MNLSGHGSRGGRSALRRTSADDFVADIAQVVERMPGPPVLIGHSMGGYLIQKYLECRTAPAAVLLASMPARGGVRVFNRLLRRHTLRTIRMHLTMNAYAQIETPELAREALFSPDIPAEKLARYHGLLQEESYRIGWDMSFFNVVRTERVRKIPLLVLGAAKDRLILPQEVEETAAAYGTRAEFFDAAHDMMLEAEWASVAGRIREWLNEKGF
jgi:alpha-beta hydrolase superfamily lysophospholipase